MLHKVMESRPFVWGKNHLSTIEFLKGVILSYVVKSPSTLSSRFVHRDLYYWFKLI